MQAQFEALDQAMRAGLTDIRLVHPFDDSVVEAPVYVVGRTPQGDVVGLKSTRIWT